MMVPDGEEHSKFKNVRDGRGRYMICNKFALKDYSALGEFHNILFRMTLIIVPGQQNMISTLETSLKSKGSSHD